jgi:hypothetical protein
MPDDLDQKAIDDLIFQAARSDAPVSNAWKPPDATPLTFEAVVEALRREPPPAALVVHPGLADELHRAAPVAAPGSPAALLGMPVLVNRHLPPDGWAVVPPRLNRPVVVPDGPPAPADDGFAYRIALRTDIPPLTLTRMDLGLEAEPRLTRWQRFKAWVRRLLVRA